MNVLFRLQRYGVVLPRLLAAGQQNVKLWQTQSFLLTEPPREAVPLPQFLLSAPPATCRQVMAQAARALRQMHQATCYMEKGKYDDISGLLTVCRHANGGHAVALATVHGIEKCPHPNPVRAQRDLAALAQALAHSCSRTDLLRGLLAYVGQSRLTFVSKRFAWRVLGRLARPGRRRRVPA
jgi:Lipopolysaccharide kinase (Kdo/WaaP) family